MAKKWLDYFDILAAREAYAAGKNVTEVLRKQKNVPFNTPEIIEAAYDLQAGEYIKYANNNKNQAKLYASELASILERHVKVSDSLLDIGAGELTTLSSMVKLIANCPKLIYAFDISWSRLYKGVEYAKMEMGLPFGNLIPFVGEISAIPLFDKSINVVTSSHALEPNGENLKELLRELFRVAIDKVILFEPCYEMASAQGQDRMDRLGYIKNIPGVVDDLGGVLIDRVAIKNTVNSLNPTACFLIEPPALFDFGGDVAGLDVGLFSAPGTNYPLIYIDDFYFSNDTGLCYPILKNIPILRKNTALLASSLCSY